MARIKVTLTDFSEIPLIEPGMSVVQLDPETGEMWLDHVRASAPVIRRSVEIDTLRVIGEALNTLDAEQRHRVVEAMRALFQ